MSLVVVPLDGNIRVYMRKKAKDIAWSKLRGTPIAHNRYSFDLLVEFFQWIGNTFTGTRYNNVALDLSLSSVVIMTGNLPIW